MATTAAALHVLGTSEPEALARAVSEAYAALGWAAAEGGAAGRQVALVPQAGGVTLLDAAAGGPDDGTLKAVALALSRSAGPVAVTEIVDGDTAAFLLFRGGLLADAEIAGDEAAGLPAAERRALWQALFDAPPPDPGALAGATGEAALGLLCAAAGIAPGAAFARYEEAGEGALRLDFVRGAAPAPSGQAPDLAAYHDDDDCPHHRVYPAPWPIEAGRPTRLKYLMLSAGAGFDGLDLALAVDDVAGPALRLERVEAQAFAFFNGQITSGQPLAEGALEPDGSLDGAGWAGRIVPFAVPAVEPETRRRVVVILRLTLSGAVGAAARLRLHAGPVAPVAVPLALPALRVAAIRPEWVPRGGAVKDDYDRLMQLELNQPSVATLLAILRPGGEAMLADLRARVEGWLASLAPPPGTVVEMRTAKHMTASGSVTRKRVALPFEGLAKEKAWARWFAAKSDLQRLAIGIRPPGFAHPVGGFLLRRGLRDEVSEAPDAPHAAFWTVAHGDAWEALGTDEAAQRRAFAAWVAGAEVLQAQAYAVAAPPDFDDYDDYAQTHYEVLSGVDWFAEGLRGGQMTEAWCARRLRVVAPEMWLQPEMLAAAGIAEGALAGVAEIAPAGPLRHVVLRDGAALPALEEVLAPVLPGSR